MMTTEEEPHEIPDKSCSWSEVDEFSSPKSFHGNSKQETPDTQNNGSNLKNESLNNDTNATDLTNEINIDQNVSNNVYNNKSQESSDMGYTPINIFKPPCVEPSMEKSLEHKKRGNSYFTHGAYDEAIHEYNMAIDFAPIVPKIDKYQTNKNNKNDIDNANGKDKENENENENENQSNHKNNSNESDNAKQNENKDDIIDKSDNEDNNNDNDDTENMEITPDIIELRKHLCILYANRAACHLKLVHKKIKNKKRIVFVFPSFKPK